MHRIGVIGLGRMGMRIAHRLSMQGMQVIGFNRNRAKAEEFKTFGGMPCTSPMEVAHNADVVITAVTGPLDVWDVVLGSSGLIQARNQRLIVIDVSTIDPKTSRDIAQHVLSSGMHMLDAPMSGSTHAAENGTLGFLVGGHAQVLECARPVLESLGHIYYFGGNGNGCTAKLALNLLLATMVQSLGEAFKLLEACGIDISLFSRALSKSGLSSPLFERLGSRVLEKDFAPRFNVNDLKKDVFLLDDVATQHGLDLGLAQYMKSILLEIDVSELAADYSKLVLMEMMRDSKQK
jgi:3-hydroxyisobutyrate dehydrogenase-like beta-hydroxyacid dehydrogenase